jgi:hypothetical protein
MGGVEPGGRELVVESKGPPGRDLAGSESELGPLVRARAGTKSQIFRLPGAQGMSWWGGIWMAAAGVSATAVSDLLVSARGPIRSLVFGVVFSLIAIPTISRERRKQQRFLTTPLISRLAAGTAVAGNAVRILGTIEPQAEPTTAPGGDARVVYCRTLFWEAGQDGRATSTAREDVRGVPFAIRLLDGALVQLRVDEVNLRDEPGRLTALSAGACQALGAATRGRLFRREIPVRQAILEPGDRVEAIGFLRSEVNVEGAAAPTRGVPLLHRLAPVPGQGIWMRRLGPV